MALNETANPVLVDACSPHLFYQVLDDLTSQWHSPVNKVVNMPDKDLFLFVSKALVLKGKSFLSGLSEPANAPRKG
jgi:hypothetical protein